MLKLSRQPIIITFHIGLDDVNIDARKMSQTTILKRQIRRLKRELGTIRVKICNVEMVKYIMESESN